MPPRTTTEPVTTGSAPLRPGRRYPPVHRLRLTENLYGHTVSDPFRWLEDSELESTTIWSRAQDELFQAAKRGWPGRRRLRERLAELATAGWVSLPVARRERFYMTGRGPEFEHPVLSVIEEDGRCRVLVDPMQLDPTGRTSLDAWHPSKEGHYLAYQVSSGGTEESVLWVVDVDSGAVVDGPIDRLRRSPVAWLPGGKAFYYVRRLAPSQVPAGEEQYHRKVWLHYVGTSPDSDVLVFGQGFDKVHYYSISVSRDGRWLAVSASKGASADNDLWLADLTANGIDQPEFREVQSGKNGYTSLRIRPDTTDDDRIFLATTFNAERGQINTTTPRRPTVEHWEKLIGEDSEAVLEDFVILDGPDLRRPLAVVEWTRHAVSELTLHDLRSGRNIGYVPLPGLGSIGALTGDGEGSRAWFSYADYRLPPSVYEFDGRTREVSVWAHAPGTPPIPDVTCRQIVYTSADGTPVRMFVISGAGVPDRPRPTILSGYGGFGVSITPSYTPSILAWVEAGGVYAIANLRGGGEEGDAWHRAGMREHKQNVFDDLHAAAGTLIRDGWTTPAQLGINGGSNGGLLVGAALTQRPDLYRAVVCSAPLLDMIRYEHSGLGAMWTEEYGSANSPSSVANLLAYSPYHNVRQGVEYPAVLFTVFDADTRVDPLHARKMCAALQHATAGNYPILLRTEAGVGHGARSRSRSIELTADVLSFFAAELGLPLELEAAEKTGPTSSHDPKSELEMIMLVAEDAPKYRITITDPQVMQTLTHPERIALMDFLAGQLGGVTAEVCAKACGLPKAVAAEHLRQLVEARVVDTSTDPNGHVLWRAVARSYSIETHEVDEGSRQHAKSVAAAWLSRDERRVLDWLDRSGEESDEWDEAATVTGRVLLVTAEELLGINAAIEELLRPYSRRERLAGRPAGARPVSTLYRAIPMDEA